MIPFPCIYSSTDGTLEHTLWTVQYTTNRMITCLVLLPAASEGSEESVAGWSAASPMTLMRRVIPYKLLGMWTLKRWSHAHLYYARRLKGAQQKVKYLHLEFPPCNISKAIRGWHVCYNIYDVENPSVPPPTHWSDFNYCHRMPPLILDRRPLIKRYHSSLARSV